MVVSGRAAACRARPVTRIVATMRMRLPWSCWLLALFSPSFANGHVWVSDDAQWRGYALF